MHFCTNCENMYYVRLSDNDDKQLIYYCRKCGNEDTIMNGGSVIVSKTNLKKKEQQFNHIINQYTKLDPTLPRISNIDCPNPECETNKEDSTLENEIIYIRYDNDNMKYVYLCTHCDFVWNNEDNK